MMITHIRNFSIIAHIDHGKSTLSDRLIQFCGGLQVREMKSQVLDSMDLERERGITIKSQSASLKYRAQNGKLYQLNLIDTPGHVDFSYEVSRSLSACEGAILVVDVTQGVEAQTIANYQIAVEMNLKIIVVLNKIDVLTAEPDRVSQEIKDILGIDIDCIIRCSAKTGYGVLELLERLVCDIPYPPGDPKASVQALIIDSWFNNYLGIILLICIKNGFICTGDKLLSMGNGLKYTVDRIGIFTPKQVNREILNCGEVGWLICSMRGNVSAVVGDTLTVSSNPARSALPGFKKIQPYVYAGLFPANIKDQEVFRDALYKLSLNDSSLFYEPERSELLGSGFRCGFLGMLHMEIVQERLKREYCLFDLIVTAPMVVYKILTSDDQIVFIDSPLKLSLLKNIKEIQEPIALCSILVSKKYLGSIIALCIKKRGVQRSMVYYEKQVSLVYELPMSEIILDFFDCIKSISRGYSSFEYKFSHFQSANIVCLEILINGFQIDALSILIHREKAMYYSRTLVDKLKMTIPRQQFDIIIQALVDHKIIVRGIIKQFRKNVIAKCYGGDVTRKRKLLYKQKVGKKRMQAIGKVYLPHSIFLSILQVNNQKNN